LLTALTRPPTPAIARCELTHMGRAPIDIEEATRQHAAYQRALAEAGARVVSLPPLPEQPDAVFVEDTGVALPEIGVVARMGASSRRLETGATLEALSLYRRIVEIEPPGALEGGDVNVAGRTILVGLSSRTNLEGAAALRSAVEPLGYRVIEVPVTGCLHLTTACTVVGEGLLVANRAWIDALALGGFEIIDAHPGEPWGGNALRIGQRVLHPSACPRTGERLRSAGLDAVPVRIDELMKAEAGLTCMSLLLETDAAALPPGAHVIEPAGASAGRDVEANGVERVGSPALSRPARRAARRSASGG